MSKESMTDEELIDAYFSDPDVKQLLSENCGLNGRIKVDWENKKITAAGDKNAMEWDLDVFIAAARGQFNQ